MATEEKPCVSVSECHFAGQRADTTVSVRMSFCRTEGRHHCPCPKVILPDRAQTPLSVSESHFAGRRADTTIRVGMSFCQTEGRQHLHCLQQL